VRPRRRIAAAILCASLGASPGCAHRQVTNRDVVIGAAVVAGFALLVYLAVSQCHKGANYCDNSPSQ